MELYCIDHERKITKFEPCIVDGLQAILMDKSRSNLSKEEKEKLNNYQIYLPLIKTIYKIKTKEILKKYNSYLFKIHVFDNESNYKRKIKLQKV